jgi:pantetheine-phosphate adenylyltransferase
MSPSSRLAIVPGSFDPVTLGHADIVSRAAALFDRVLVGVLINADKRPLFSVDERVRLIREAVAASGLTNVEVEAFDGLLVDFAARRGACAVVRGVRSSTDLDYETQLAGMNRHLNRAVETIMLPADGAVAHISSRLVRDIIAHGGSIDGLVPDVVRDAVQARRQAAVTRQV